MVDASQTAIMKTVAESVGTFKTFLADYQSIDFIRFQWLGFSEVLNARVATTNFSSSLA
jgi:hypothetical protein